MMFIYSANFDYLDMLKLRFDVTKDPGGMLKCRTYSFNTADAKTACFLRANTLMEFVFIDKFNNMQ